MTKEFTITIVDPNVSVTGVSITDDKDVSITSFDIYVGETKTLKAVVTPSEASNKNVTWDSATKDVASVSATGVVTGLKAGSSKITVTTADGGKTADVTVTVKNRPVTGITVAPASQTIGKSETVTLTATVVPAEATIRTVEWVSDKPTVATVDKTTGKVTGVAAGTATITATASDGSGVKGTAAITVDAEKPYISTTELPNGTVNVQYTETTLAVASTTDSNPLWSISSGNLPKGLDITSRGKISGKPTEEGTFKFTIQVKCTVSGVERLATKEFTIVIDKEAAVKQGTPEVKISSGSALKGVTDRDKVLEDFVKAQSAETGYVKTYTLNVETKAPAGTEKTTVDTKIKELFNGLKANDQFKPLYLDIGVVLDKLNTSTNQSDKTNVPDLGQVVEIHLTVEDTVTKYPNTMQLVRNHGNQGLTVFTRLTEKPAKADWKDATFYVNGTDLYVYSRWFSTYVVGYATVDTWKVKFDVDGGSVVEDRLVVKGETLGRLAAPTKEGYEFDGWYTDAARTTPFDMDTTAITADLTLYAKWTETDGMSANSGPRSRSGTADQDEATVRGSRTGDNNEAERIARLLAIMTTTWIVLFNALAFGKKRRQRIRRR
ncbi:MAG: Ig-like domain-containing protein [Lachnospiraceae bacterium]|nr:Ig-like domain-containing protein [Lachnospiraceae bacterium]